jgi:hypothetical protein
LEHPLQVVEELFICRHLIPVPRRMARARRYLLPIQRAPGECSRPLLPSNEWVVSFISLHTTPAAYGQKSRVVLCGIWPGLRSGVASQMRGVVSEIFGRLSIPPTQRSRKTASTPPLTCTARLACVSFISVPIFCADGNLKCYSTRRLRCQGALIIT